LVQRKRRGRNRQRQDAALIDEVLRREAPADAMRGIVVRAHGLWYEVRTSTPQETWIATMRGVLKKQARRTDIVAVGDLVWISDAGDGEAVIERVEPRRSVFARTARNTRDTEQVILANPDQVLIVFAAREPEPHLRMLDRFIILAERQQLPVRIVVTKTDLEQDLDADDPLGPAEERFAAYDAIYPVHFTSPVTGAGLLELREALAGRISVVAGPSGVGKSTLLNALDPRHHRETGEVSEATGKGRHTTIGALLHEIAPDTFIADTPGMRALAMHAVPEDELEWCYREFRPYLGQCRFGGCTHVHEPGCAIRDAVRQGDIPAERYESYVMVREESAGAG
jgi:ribosome biogenesis GTPase / thiamine phosphate phosphatase